MPSADGRGAAGGSVGVVVCVDIGSTFTKAALVDLDARRLIGTAAHPTTLATDVMDGVDACVAALAEADPRAADARVLGCSSAGGGLRIAVLGNEALVTAEAGRRVALSSGGHVVAVVAAADHAEAGPAPEPEPESGGGRVPETALSRVLGHTTDEARPDVVLLLGGTDGGNREVVVGAARALVRSGWRGPVVVAGNRDASEEVAGLLDDEGVPHQVAANAVPRIGVLEPDGARAAVREVFLRHVIGGKALSRRPELVALVRGATPDVVLTGVEVLAATAGDVVVVDVGGATTDVHSVVEIDPEQATLGREVVGPARVTRTVEGDLGLRWSAATTVAAAGLDDLAEDAARRVADPGLLPTTDADRDADEAIARAAVGLALRRHAGRSRVVVSPEGRVVERTGRDLREVDLVVGSGGVLRHGRPGVAERVLGGVVADRHEGGWQLPERAAVTVDRDYVLAAVGLLAEEHPEAARALAAAVCASAGSPTVST